VRTEGLGLGMLIAVELGKQEEFDKLWTYAKRNNRVASGANEGYFNSYCDVPTGLPLPCVDPYGAEQFAMALIFAHDVWGDADGIDYEADALDILDVMKNKEKMNGGIVDDVINMFDAETHLAFDVPDRRKAQQTRPSVLMPAYYALWADATGDQFWVDAAEAARAFFPTVANTKTGLVPLRAYFDGTPVADSDTFSAESYRLLINLVLDEIWLRGNPSGVSQCNTVLSFFSDVGIDKYVGNYELDGTPTSMGREYALVAVNGMAASISKNSDRKAYIEAVWKQELPTGSNRYYTGILQLFALLVLSGKMQVL
jgi:oligosaccharide reducing-end xylanase